MIGMGLVRRGGETMSSGVVEFTQEPGSLCSTVRPMEQERAI